MDPLTTEEVNSLDAFTKEGIDSGSITTQRLIRTIRDLERERDDKEYARKEWAETAHRVILERDEFQRKLEECERRLNGASNG